MERQRSAIISGKARSFLAVLCSIALVFGMIGPASAMAADASSVDQKRIGGKDRLHTAVLMSQEGWSQADNVVLTGAADAHQVDALTVGPLAKALNAPILLVEKTGKVPQVTMDEIKRLKPTTIYITSGTTVISKELRDSLRAQGYKLCELGGADRYQTSLNIALELLKIKPRVDTLAVVSGEGNADALSVASIAASQGWPILLSSSNSLTPTTAAFIAGFRPAKVYVVGGLDRIPKAVADSLPNVTRLAGSDRYATNREILKHFASSFDFSRGLYLTNGDNGRQSDALSSAPFIAGAPLLLHHGGALDNQLKDFISSVLAAQSINKLTALGGEASMSATIHSQIAALLAAGAPAPLQLEKAGVYPLTIGGTTVNYLVFKVLGGSYTAASYLVNGATVTPTPVLTNGQQVSYIKLELPAAATSVSIEVSAAGKSVYSGSDTVSAAAAAPTMLFGQMDIGFAAFNHDITAGITDVVPTQTSFDAAGSVAVPQNFITSGTRAQWPANDRNEKVDVISSATYGDAFHFLPPGGMVLNYDDPATKAEGHAATAVKAADIGVSFDLLANATLLGSSALNAATAQSENILALAANISYIPEAQIYKAKYLFADGSFGAREAQAHNPGVAKAWPSLALTDPINNIYSNNWTAREAQINFNMTGTTSTDFWNNYLSFLYGGYIENITTGVRQPLVFLQNIFTHLAHINIDVSINDQIFSRFSSLDFPGDYQIVLYAKGCEDVVFESHLARYINGGASIEQGTTFNIDPAVPATMFEDKELHIQGADAGFNAAQATLVKGSTAVDGSLYQISGDASEITVAFNDDFFTGDFRGSYTIKLAVDTADVVSKPLNFTVNQWIARPTLSASGGEQQSGETQDVPASFGATDTVVFSSDDFAKTFVTSGRTISSISVLDTEASAPVFTSVVTRSGDGSSPYQLNMSALTPGHTYKLTVIATNFAVGASAAAASTTVVYYITIPAT